MRKHFDSGGNTNVVKVKGIGLDGHYFVMCTFGAGLGRDPGSYVGRT